MDAANISINQARGVSINIDTLQAIKQRVLQSVKQHCNVGRLTLPRLYRQELRLVRTLAHAVDGKAGDLWIGGWVAACVYLIFIYA